MYTNSNYLNDLYVDWKREEEEAEWRKEMNEEMNTEDEEEYVEDYSNEDFPF